MGYALPILAYHKVDSRRELGITSLSPARFEKQVRVLKHEGYTGISPRSLSSLVLGKIYASYIQICRFGKIKDVVSSSVEAEDGDTANTVPPAKSVLITFDDGYEGIYTYAYPILKKYGYNALIFLTTGYIDKYNNWDASPGPRFKHLNWSQIREMADNGIWFGSHGVNHTFLTRQSYNIAKYEIEASKKMLEDGLGQPVPFFSYPYGNYDNRIINLVQEAGYEAAFSLKPELLKAGCAHSRTLAYTLPRIAVYFVDNMWAFKAKIGCSYSGLLPYKQKVKNRLINRCSYASILVEKLKL